MVKRRLGAHKSIAGGYHEAVRRVDEIGGNCLQMFSKPPRQWRTASVSEEACEQFRAACDEYGVGPVYFHASYLVNLAGENPNRDRSIQSLIDELTVAHRCGVRGSVIHVGSFPKIKTLFDAHDDGNGERYEPLVNAITHVLEETPEDTLFIIENMGMRKIGRSLEEIAYLIERIDDDRVRVCLDTCHLHAAGYDISSTEKLDAFLAQFDELIGLARLECWHLNDSRDTFGALRDRHANIGEGYVGTGVFAAILNHPKLAHLPCLIETPGFDGEGPDKKNLDILKRMIAG